jgi:hypothetical protein
MRVSTLQKMGAIARVAAQQVKRTRTGRALISAAGATARSFAHVLHLLWLEVTGAVFIFMAAVGGIALAREVAKYQAGQATAGRIAVAICFTLTFAWFGVSSFWRVRQKGRGRAQ